MASPDHQIHEFRAEVFKPPYAFSTARPVITSSPSAPVAMGDAYAVGHRGAADGAVLVAPGAVTHQVRRAATHAARVAGSHCAF